jgi:ankyrin repeat protein
MIAKIAYVARVIRGLLTTGLVLVLMPAPDMAFGHDSLSHLIDYRYLVQYGEPDLMANLHFGNTLHKRNSPSNPPYFRPVPRYVKMRPLGSTPMPPLPPFPPPRKALMNAAGRGDPDEVKLLLGKGADVNARDERGWTPLMEAANRGYPEIVKLLLDKGADVNLKHQYGWTALSIAKGKGNKEIEKLLKARGAKK